MAQLHETTTGKRLIEGTLPRIAEALENLVKALTQIECPRCKKKHKAIYKFRDGFYCNSCIVEMLTHKEP